MQIPHVQILKFNYCSKYSFLISDCWSHIRMCSRRNSIFLLSTVAVRVRGRNTGDNTLIPYSTQRIYSRILSCRGPIMQDRTLTGSRKAVCWPCHAVGLDHCSNSATSTGSSGYRVFAARIDHRDGLSTNMSNTSMCSNNQNYLCVIIKPYIHIILNKSTLQ